MRMLLKNLLEMFEFYLIEWRLKKPIGVLTSSVSDLKLIIQKLIAKHFIHLSRDEQSRFCETIAVLLTERAALLGLAELECKKYFDYVIQEILACFELVIEVESEAQPDLRRDLIMNPEILDPFDFGQGPALKLVDDNVLYLP